MVFYKHSQYQGVNANSSAWMQQQWWLSLVTTQMLPQIQ